MRKQRVSYHDEAGCMLVMVKKVSVSHNDTKHESMMVMQDMSRSW